MIGQIRKNKIDDYWTTDSVISTPFFSKIMTRNRFYQILRFLHFSNNTETIKNANKFYKIEPVIKYFLHKFNTIYQPEQELFLDEYIILYHGRFFFPINNLNKIIKHRILVRMLFEANNGYICNFQLYYRRDDNLKNVSTILQNNINL